MKDPLLRFRILETGKVLAGPVLGGERFFTRARGMIGRKFNAGLQGIWFPRCSSVHMFFMAIPLDILFLDREGTILRLVPSAAPWTPALWVPRADSVLELPAGMIGKHSLSAGVRLIKEDFSVFSGK